jgi:hypothetical protein
MRALDPSLGTQIEQLRAVLGAGDAIMLQIDEQAELLQVRLGSSWEAGRRRQEMGVGGEGGAAGPAAVRESCALPGCVQASSLLAARRCTCQLQVERW